MNNINKIMCAVLPCFLCGDRGIESFGFFDGFRDYFQFGFLIE